MGVDESAIIKQEEANQGNEGLDPMKMTENDLLASPSERVNDISIEDNTEIKDGSISPADTSSKTFLPQEGSLLVNSSPSLVGAKKSNSKRPAFVAVKNPKPVTSSAVGIQFNETKVDSEEKEDPFFTLLTGGNAKGSLF